MQLTRKQADKQAGVITTLENNVPDHEPLQTLPTVYSSTNVLTEIAHIEEIVTTDCTYANNEIDDFADIDTTGLSDEDLASTLPTVQNCANVPTLNETYKYPNFKLSENLYFHSYTPWKY